MGLESLMMNFGRSVLAHINGNSKGMWRVSLHTDGLNMVKLVLAWTPPGPRSSGRPPNSWDQKLTSYCRYRNFGHWADAAEDQQWWESHLDYFTYFCQL